MTDGLPPDARASGRQGAFWLGLLLCAALALGGASFATAAYLADGQPATVVRAYFAALQRGDAAAALGYGDLPAGAPGLLTDRVLAAQRAVAPIAGLTVIGVFVHGDNADVDVSYALGRRPVLDRVPVVRRGHGWRLAHGAVAVALHTSNGAAHARLAGAPVPTGTFALFPGAIPVVFDTPNLELDSVAGAAVRFNGLPDILVRGAVSAAGRRALGPALRAALASCLAGRSSAQAICPVPDPFTAVPGTLRGTLTQLDVDQLDLVVASPGGRIDIGGAATVSGTFSALDDNDLAVSTPATTVNLRAHSSATQPGAIVWETQ